MVICFSDSDRYRVKAWGTTLVSESDSGSSRSVESSPSSSPHQSGRKPFVKAGSLDDLEEAEGRYFICVNTEYFRMIINQIDIYR